MNGPQNCAKSIVSVVNHPLYFLAHTCLDPGVDEENKKVPRFDLDIYIRPRTISCTQEKYFTQEGGTRFTAAYRHFLSFRLFLLAIALLVYTRKIKTLKSDLEIYFHPQQERTRDILCKRGLDKSSSLSLPPQLEAVSLQPVGAPAASLGLVELVTLAKTARTLACTKSKGD